MSIDARTVANMTAVTFERITMGACALLIAAALSLRSDGVVIGSISLQMWICARLHVAARAIERRLIE